MKKFLPKLFVKSNGSHFSFGKADGDSAGTTEQLRAEHQMEWVGHMKNSFRNIAHSASASFYSRSANGNFSFLRKHIG